MIPLIDMKLMTRITVTSHIPFRREWEKVLSRLCKRCEHAARNHEIEPPYHCVDCECKGFLDLKEGRKL